MKTPEDEAFDDLARNQGAWGGGFPAKRAMAADKLQEDLTNYGTAWSQDGKRIDPTSVYKEPVTEREALKLALEFVESINLGSRSASVEQQRKAIAAIKEALAQEQETVAWALEWTFDGEEKGRRLYDDERHCKLDAENDGGICRPLVYGYTAPPKREWVGLTDEDLLQIQENVRALGGKISLLRSLSIDIEAKLKEKNT